MFEANGDLRKQVVVRVKRPMQPEVRRLLAGLLKHVIEVLGGFAIDFISSDLYAVEYQLSFAAR